MELSEIELLQGIMHKLESIESRLDNLEQAAIKESMNGISLIGDVIDEQFGKTPEDCQQSYEGVQHLIEIINLLRNPDVLGTLKIILENAPLLSTTIEQLNEVPSLISIASDSLDEFFAEANANGLDIEDLSKNFSKLMKKVIVLLEDGSINAVLDSGIMDHAAINFVGALGRSLAKSACEVGEAGPLEVFGGIFDRDIRRSMGFVKNLAKHLGEQFDDNQLCQLNSRNEIKLIHKG